MDAADAFRRAGIDAAGCEFRAGDVNAHTHLYSALAPLGMPPPREKPANFPQILERVWWRLDRALDAESIRAGARLYAAEALLAGTTTLIDHHESPNFIEGSLDVLADACQEIGIRALLCYGASERNGGRDEGRRGLAECARFLRENRRPRVRGAVGLHASFTVSDATIREAGEIAHAHATIVHVHVAEDASDVQDARRRGHTGPLERLLALDALPPGSILAHGVHLAEDQVRRCADLGLWLVHNPRSNRGNGVGWARALSASPRVALGTDGYPADMAVEERALHDDAKTQGDAPAASSRRRGAGRELATTLFGTAHCAGDAVALRDGALQHVLVGGVPVVRARTVSGAPLARLRHEAGAQAARLWQRMAALP